MPSAKMADQLFNRDIALRRVWIAHFSQRREKRAGGDPGHPRATGGPGVSNAWTGGHEGSAWHGGSHGHGWSHKHGRTGTVARIECRCDGRCSSAHHCSDPHRIRVTAIHTATRLRWSSNGNLLGANAEHESADSYAYAEPEAEMEW
jgi:hypothetical protein